jgi:predicted small secreted protein
MNASIISTIAVSVCVFVLTGCTTMRHIERDAPVSKEKMEEARYLIDTTRQTNTLLYRLGTASADQCTASDAPHRAPFSLLFNAANNPSDELRTAVYRVSGIAELPVVQIHIPELRAYEGARVLTVNGNSTTNMNKVYTAMHDALEDNHRLELALDDGRSLTTAPVVGCPSLVFTDYTDQLKETFNNFNGAEVTPKSWLKLARNDDERAFVLARSIYFTAAAGQAKLYRAYLGGSAVSGVLRGLTFGLGTLVVDPKTVVVRMRRNASRTDADVFALDTMRRAGFDAQAAIAFAQRSIDEGAAWPSEADELKFDAERLASLKQAL